MLCTYLYPPDPINSLCSLSGIQISGNYLTYYSVRIFKYCAENQMLQYLIVRTRVRSTGFITQPGWLFHFHQINMIGRKCLVPGRYQLPKDESVGQDNKLFYMIHRFQLYIHVYIYIRTHIHKQGKIIRINRFIFIHIYVYIYIYIYIYIYMHI